MIAAVIRKEQIVLLSPTIQ